MMKLQNIYIGLFFILLTIFWYIFLPGTLWQIEASDFFSFSPEFLRSYWAAPQGSAILLSSFIAQFFQIQTVGALIMGLIPTLFIWSQISTLPPRSRSMGAWMPFISGCFFAALFIRGLSLQTGLELLILSILLSLYSILSKHFLRIIAVVTYIVIAYTLFPPLFTILLFVMLCFIEWQKSGKFYARIAVVSITIIAILIPLFLHSFIPELPYSERFAIPGLQPQQQKGLFFLIGAMLGTRLLAFKPIDLKTLPMRLFLYIAPMVLFFVLAFFIKDQTDEKGYRLDQALVRSQWSYIIDNFDESRLKEDPRQLRYLALALNNENQLSSKLFSYPFRSENDFYFQQCLNQPCSFFHAIFYNSLGVKNEAIHQAFQNGISSNKGISFLTATQLREWYAAIGKKPIAERYDHLLSHSTLYEPIELVTDSTITPIDSTAYFFIGARPLVSDLARLVDADRNNKLALDYLMCSLLLNRDLNKFWMMMKYYPVKENEVLPRHYIEALLLINSQKPEFKITKKYTIPESYMDGFKEFITLLDQKEIGKLTLKQKYHDSYWYYFANK
ncbi:MAG: DUF6057 family protein [Bacteroidales bacterium]